MRIVVHRGQAHADDFLAACVCHYQTGAPVVRSDPDQEMLDSPDFWVLDQGGRFEPELHNFDHHQLKEEICSLTMVLDYMFGLGYRNSVRGLRFIEIMDSYGLKKAAEFAGVTQESLEIVASPIHSAVLKSFSRFDGAVGDPMIEMMWAVGREICAQITDSQKLLDALTEGYAIMEASGVKVLDVTRCVPPAGYSHDSLPTKIWCKSKGVNPDVILTRDARRGGFYRMVSVNIDSLSFLPNGRSSFTHASGLLTSFENYNDHQEILAKHVVRS
jgi:hypothetical protein